VVSNFVTWATALVYEWPEAAESWAMYGGPPDPKGGRPRTADKSAVMTRSKLAAMWGVGENFLTWATAFERLCKVKGVELGSGKGNPTAKAAKSAALPTAADVAESLGVAAKTARTRRQRAKQIGKHKDLAVAVQAGEMDVAKAAKEAKKREKKREREAERALSRAVPLEERERDLGPFRVRPRGPDGGGPAPVGSGDDNATRGRWDL